MAFLSTTDFVGKNSVSLNEFTESDLQSYIDRYETKLLVELFGKALYDLWNGSTDAIYTTLTAPLIFQSENCCSGKVYESKGIKEMLAGFIYWEYERDIYTQRTLNGSMKQTSENGEDSSHAMSNLHGRYDEALETYNAIQAYIEENSSIYPEFNGVKKFTVIPFF
jgi:hypothetical protein